LKEDLNRAVEQEEYEKAANIRDKIKDLEQCNE
ncbi:MAG: UvrB/UvrC motif-containing protein, partial [Clostridium sp.]